MAAGAQRPGRRQHEQRGVGVDHRFGQPDRAEPEHIARHHQARIAAARRQAPATPPRARLRWSGGRCGRPMRSSKTHGRDDGIKAGVLLIVGPCPGTTTSHHDHDHSELSETQLRVRALETVLTEKGYVDPAALDLLIETYEKKVGPRNGARVVAKAWADPDYPRAAAQGRDARDRRTRLRRPPGRAHRRAREHAEAAQHGRVHAVLLLSVAGARPAAGLVQVGALPLARGRRSARRARRFRRRRCRRTPKSASGIRPPRFATS